MASWPASLPAPLVAGYSLSPADPCIRTDFEIGPKRVRRRTSARQDSVSVSWVMSASQFEEFRSWFDDAEDGIAGGASWFLLSLQLGVGGEGVSEARFSQVFTADFLGGGFWRVSATLEVR